VEGNGPPYRWTVATVGPIRGGSNAVRVRFEALARRGAKRLTNRTSASLLDTWLDALKLDIPSDLVGHVTLTNQDGDQREHAHGEINRICQVSADFCYILESRALDAEQAAEAEQKYKSDPRNWPPLMQELQAIESIKKLHAQPPKQISEGLVRSLIARRTGVKPEEVPWQQIQLEVSGLLTHYGPVIKLVPEATLQSSSPVNTPPKKSHAKIRRKKKKRRRNAEPSTVAPAEPTVQSAKERDAVQTVRARVDAFIGNVFQMKARRITRTDIWRVAGYTEATQFERFQRNKNQSAGSVARFERVLRMNPTEFLERLDRLKK